MSAEMTSSFRMLAGAYAGHRITSEELDVSLRIMTLALAAAFTPIQARAAQGAAVNRPAPQDIVASVDRFAAHVMSLGVTPALGVAIVMDGRTVYTRAFGMADVTAGIPADSATLWYIASTSKSFIGVAVSLLAEQGALDFDAPITRLLPNAAWHPEVDASRLTLAQFLTHTMGLRGGPLVINAAFTGNIPEPRWPQLLAYSDPLPTRDLIYNNLGYNVAAMVIDAQRQEGWRGYLERFVFGPAGMKDTYHRISGIDAKRIAKPHSINANLTFATQPFRKTDVTMNAAGGHLATLGDLARWLIVNMQHGSIDGRQAIPRAAMHRSHRMLAEHTVPASRMFGPFERTGWAPGWDIGAYRGERMVSRFGGYESVRSHLSYLPGRGIGVVVQTTAVSGSSLTDVIAAYAYDLESGRPDALARADSGLQAALRRLRSVPDQQRRFDSVRAARRLPRPHPLGNYTGTFEHAAFGPIVWTQRSEHLWFEFGAYDGRADVFDAARNQFRIDLGGSGVIVEFVLDDSGRARAVILDRNTFVRVSAG